MQALFILPLLMSVLAIAISLLAGVGPVAIIAVLAAVATTSVRASDDDLSLNAKLLVAARNADGPAIAQALPNDRIALQWDVCQEVLAWEGYYEPGPVDVRIETIDVLAKVGDAVPVIASNDRPVCAVENGKYIAQLNKIHHATIDGASGAEMLSVMLDRDADWRPSQPMQAWKPDTLPSSNDLLRHGRAPSVFCKTACSRTRRSR